MQSVLEQRGASRELKDQAGRTAADWAATQTEEMTPPVRATAY